MRLSWALRAPPSHRQGSTVRPPTTTPLPLIAPPSLLLTLPLPLLEGEGVRMLLHEELTAEDEGAWEC